MPRIIDVEFLNSQGSTRIYEVLLSCGHLKIIKIPFHTKIPSSGDHLVCEKCARLFHEPR